MARLPHTRRQDGQFSRPNYDRYVSFVSQGRATRERPFQKTDRGIGGKLVLPARILFDAGSRLQKLTGVLGYTLCRSLSFRFAPDTGLTGPQVKKRGPL